MVLASQKWFLTALVLVLAFSIEARMLSTYQEKVPYNIEHVKNGKKGHFGRIDFGMLLKRIPVPPSSPSNRTNGPSPPPIFFTPRFENVKEGGFGMLLNRIPPSSPSNRTNGPPPPPIFFTPRFENVKEGGLGMLLKRIPVPPSGPSRRTSDSPPPPMFFPPWFENVKEGHFGTIDFGMLPKGIPVPPSGPSRPPVFIPGRN